LINKILTSFVKKINKNKIKKTKKKPLIFNTLEKPKHAEITDELLIKNTAKQSKEHVNFALTLATYIKYS
jgi:hypothetical protein